MDLYSRHQTRKPHSCQALCRCGSHWQAQVVFWNLVALCFLRMRVIVLGCDSPSLVHPSLPHSSVSPSFIRLSLWSHLCLGYGWVPIALLATDFSPHSNSWKDHFWTRGTPAPLQPVHPLCLFKSFGFLESKSQQGFYRLCLILVVLMHPQRPWHILSTGKKRWRITYRERKSSILHQNAYLHSPGQSIKSCVWFYCYMKVKA